MQNNIVTLSPEVYPPSISELLESFTKFDTLGLMLKHIFDVLDKFSGIIGAFIIFFQIAKFTYNNYASIPFEVYPILLGLAGLFLFIFFRQIRRNYLALKAKQIEKDILKEQEKKQDKQLFSTKEILTTSKIKRWLTLADYKASLWADDAIRDESYGSYSFYYSSGYLSHNFGISYYSSSRGEKIEMSYGRDNTSLRELNPKYMESLINNKNPYLPFYKNQPRWRNALLAVYKFIENKWDDRLNMFVCSVGEPGTGHISITYNYERGHKRIIESGSFESDGEYIYNDNHKIKI